MTIQKRIDFLSPPFSGHLNPIIGLAQRLADHYQVRVISTQSAQSSIRQAGLEGVVVMRAYEKTLLNIVNPPYRVGRNPMRLHRQFKSVLNLYLLLGTELDDLYHLEKPDLVIADFTLFVVGRVTTNLNIPWWTSHPSPCMIETCDGPPAYLHGKTPARSFFHRINNQFGHFAVRMFKKTIFAVYRKNLKTMGIQQLYRSNGSEAFYSPECILGLGLKDLEFSNRWPNSVKMIGPSFYTPPIDPSTPVFTKNKKYILVTLGTHLQWYKNKLASKIQDISRRFKNVEFHFTHGMLQGDQKYVRTDNFIHYPFVNYERHLPNYDLVIHHGGAGILYYCMLYGIPAVVHPVDYDQFDHAARLQNVGVAIWSKHLDDLEPSMIKALHSSRLSTNCKHYSRLLANAQHENQIYQLVKNRLGPAFQS